MSLEMLVFLEKSRIPDRGGLQGVIESLGVPLQLNPALDLVGDRGFSPSSIKELSSGFEIDSQSSQRVAGTLPRSDCRHPRMDYFISVGWQHE